MNKNYTMDSVTFTHAAQMIEELRKTQKPKKRETSCTGLITGK